MCFKTSCKTCYKTRYKNDLNLFKMKITIERRLLINDILNELNFVLQKIEVLKDFDQEEMEQETDNKRSDGMLSRMDLLDNATDKIIDASGYLEDAKRPIE